MRDTPHLHIMKWLNKMAKQYGERKKIKLKNIQTETLNEISHFNPAGWIWSN